MVLEWSQGGKGVAGHGDPEPGSFPPGRRLPASARARQQGLARRLRYEFERRGLGAQEASEASGVPAGTVEAFLSGRGGRFRDLRVLCRSLGLNPFRLVAGSYEPFRLRLHHLRPRDWLLQGALEEVFRLVEPGLPRPAHPGAAGAVDAMPPEALAAACRLTVFPFRCRSELAAGFLALGPRAAVFLNTLGPPERVRLALAHELGHFLCGHGRDVAADTPATLADEADPAEAAATRLARRLLEVPVRDPEAALERLLAEGRATILEAVGAVAPRLPAAAFVAVHSLLYRELR
ncbi:ImmA/IrrE family metallo-endopeptidase [Dissulfurirhabdus thermomarina]|uniref:ImmA/IrrE family metallo-endopeptidase n=1 Tax=Dissulfurirhabdus thermomarina TaxID=1765737 RepID=A0A6N9TMJ5_DISTH|nr:ImmA/IrrE family metallo-endopeptidase [Dissulfurirhabdus thermomarina]NDY41293.1 ImmA/IrrE family metallo-endopeptidase [Dissulfurirhabdus thermomarina]NMX23750.1 ImmA/IrrE family metallo-endopeptidase [Dissulfurirhabdus thermomarina]